jgi:hypothetical protein
MSRKHRTGNKQNKSRRCGDKEKAVFNREVIHTRKHSFILAADWI